MNIREFNRKHEKDPMNTGRAGYLKGICQGINGSGCVAARPEDGEGIRMSVHPAIERHQGPPPVCDCCEPLKW